MTDPPRRSITTSISAGISSTSRTTAAVCACSTRARSPAECCARSASSTSIRQDDAPAYNGAWSVVSVFRQRIGGGQWHRAGSVRRQAPCDAPRAARRPAGHDRRTRQRRATDQDWSFVVMVANHGPDRLSETRVDRNAARDRALLSARPSQGECSVSDDRHVRSGESGAGIGGVRDRDDPGGRRTANSSAPRSSARERMTARNARPLRRRSRAASGTPLPSRCAVRSVKRRSGSAATTPSNGSCAASRAASASICRATRGRPGRG